MASNNNNIQLHKNHKVSKIYYICNSDFISEHTLGIAAIDNT